MGTIAVVTRIVIRELRSHPPSSAETAELRVVVDDEVGDKYSNERAAWDSISRYLDDVSGIENLGLGEWIDAGDGATRDEME